MKRGFRINAYVYRGLWRWRVYINERLVAKSTRGYETDREISTHLRLLFPKVCR